MSIQTDRNADPPPRRQQERSRITQAKLLDAAAEAFAENGFNGTSTRDIAERAGVHHPLITYHFKSKDQLWRAAADRIYRDFRRTLDKVTQELAEDCPKKRVATLIRTYVHYARKKPALHNVLTREASYPNERLDWLIETHLKPLFQTSFEMIEELQRLGVAPAGNAKLLFNMIRLSSAGLLSLGNELKESSGIDIDSAETLDEIAEMLVTVFLPGEVTQHG